MSDSECTIGEDKICRFHSGYKVIANEKFDKCVVLDRYEEFARYFAEKYKTAVNINTNSKSIQISPNIKQVMEQKKKFGYVVERTMIDSLEFGIIPGSTRYRERSLAADLRKEINYWLILKVKRTPKGRLPNWDKILKAVEDPDVKMGALRLI